MFGKFSFNKKGNMEKNVPVPGKVPEHVAIIMDGNGRWAKRRGLPRIAGHREAMKTVKRITREAQNIGIKILTLYTFSTENWKRPKNEVDFLMRLPEQFLNSYLAELIENNVQVQVMGDMSRVPDYTLAAIHQAVERTKSNDGMVLNFALNYGSYAEITEAVKKIARDVLDKKLEINELQPQDISKRLISPQLPNPDLLIRTGGEVRLSNFMLWQMAYTEFYFSDIFWPDFNEKNLHEAVRSFAVRQRRFGGVKPEEGSQ